MDDFDQHQPGTLSALVHEIVAFAGSRLPLAIVIITLAAVLEGTGLVLLLPVAETIFAQTGETQSGVTGTLLDWLSAAGITTVLQQLAVMGAAFVGLVMVRAAVLLKRDVLMTELEEGFVDHIRRGFFVKLAHADWPVIKRFRKAQLLDTMTTNIGRLSQTMSFLANGLITAIMVLAYLGAAFVVSSVLGIALLGLILVGLVGAVVWMKRSRALGQRMNIANRDVMHQTTRFLDGMKAAKAARAEEQLTGRFTESITETRAISVQFVSQQARLRNVVQLIASAGALGVLLVGFGLVGLTGGELMVMAAIVMRLAPSLLSTFSGLQSISFALPAFEAIRVLERNIENAHVAQSATVVHEQAIEIDPGAALKLSDARVDVVNDDGDVITLVRSGQIEILPGQLVHIGGPSGAGKSTLVELIAGLHLPASGSVSRGDIALDAANRSAWQAQISFAPQEPFIFDGSVRDNLLWPNLQIDDDQIWEVLAQVEAADIVCGLPKGLDEELLDGGARLSGGERQRLCLARTLLRPASMLILDEATSAMDPELERSVIARLRDNIGERIVLLVSHSLNAVEHADVRIEVSDGETHIR